MCGCRGNGGPLYGSLSLPSCQQSGTRVRYRPARSHPLLDAAIRRTTAPSRRRRLLPSRRRHPPSRRRHRPGQHLPRRLQARPPRQEPPQQRCHRTSLAPSPWGIPTEQTSQQQRSESEIGSSSYPQSPAGRVESTARALAGADGTGTQWKWLAQVAELGGYAPGAGMTKTDGDSQGKTSPATVLSSDS